MEREEKEENQKNGIVLGKKQPSEARHRWMAIGEKVGKMGFLTANSFVTKSRLTTSGAHSCHFETRSSIILNRTGPEPLFTPHDNL